jgi:hypothetical protein
MEYGKRMGFERLIHCSEISYTDCAGQIVCPACNEAVLKVGSPILKREYLRHYPLRGRTDCPLRVYQIVQAALAPRIIVPHGQALDRFLARFEEIIMERQGVPPMLEFIDVLRQRSSYRRLIRNNRIILRDICLGSGRFPKLTPIVNLLKPPNGDIEALRTVVRFLTSPNSTSALIFAISFGLTVVSLAQHFPDAVQMLEPDRKHPTVAFPELADYADRPFRAWIMAFPKTETRRILIELALMMCETAMQFVLAVSYTEGT